MQGQAKCGGPNSVMVQLRLSSTLLRNSDLSCGASCTHCTNTPCSSTEPVLTSAADSTDIPSPKPVPRQLRRRMEATWSQECASKAASIERQSSNRTADCSNTAMNSTCSCR